MRISDWSSDVCSSDLWPMYHETIHYGTNLRLEFVSADKVNGIGDVLCLGNFVEGNQSLLIAAVYTNEYERRDGVWKLYKLNGCMNYFTQDRKSVGKGKSVSVSLDLVGRRDLKKKKKHS